MNFIDITQNKNTHCIKNNSVVVTNREGIQGPPGRDGATPYIDPETYHWLINGVDTGVVAKGTDGKDGERGATPYIGENGNWWIDGEDSGQAVTSIPTINPITKTWMVDGQNTGILAEGKNGADGKDGAFPIIDPKTNNWVIDGKVTEYKAVADSVSISDDGYWIINGVKTKTIAKGSNGSAPYIGDNGNWYVYSETENSDGTISKEYQDTCIHAGSQILVYSTYESLPSNAKNTASKPNEYDLYIVADENYNMYKYNNQTYYRVCGFDNLSQQDVTNILGALTNKRKSTFKSLYQALMNVENVDYDNIFDALMNQASDVKYTNILQLLMGDADLDKKYTTIIEALDQANYYQHIVEQMDSNREWMWNNVIICAGNSSQEAITQSCTCGDECNCSSKA